MGWLGGGAGAGHTAVSEAEAEAERESENETVAERDKAAHGSRRDLQKSPAGDQ